MRAVLQPSMLSLARLVGLAAVTALLAVGGWPTQAQGWYLYLPDVQGESQETHHQGWIEITSLSHEMVRPTGATSNGSASHGSLLLQKQVDSASPVLDFLCNKGSLLPSAVLECMRLSRGTGIPSLYYQIRLAGVRVVRVQSAGSAGDAEAPSEAVALDYQDIQWTYSNLDPAGNPISDLYAWWSLPLASGGDTESCVSASPASINGNVGSRSALTVTIPPFLNAAASATVTLTSADPDIASFVGASPGQVTLNFNTGDVTPQTVDLTLLKPGLTTITLASAPSWCVQGPVTVEVRGPIQNPSFEANYPSAWPHYGSISGWTGQGQIGVNQSDGPFQDNGLVPDGSQVVFLQGASSLSQELTGLQPGKTYWLQFAYNARNCCGGTVGLTVQFNGEPLGGIDSITPVGGTNAYYWTNLVFTPTASAGSLEFDSAAQGDASLLLDAVSVVQRDTNEVVIENPNFEASGLPAYPGYLNPNPLAGWVGTGNYGVNHSGDGPFADNGMAPGQGMVAFLQEAGASLSQNIAGLTVGRNYTLSFAVNARGGNAPHLRVSFGDQGVLFDEAIKPVGGTNAYQTAAISFTSVAAGGVLRFEQTVPTGDNTVLLTDVRLTANPPIIMSLPLRVALTPKGVRVSWDGPLAVPFVLQTSPTLTGPWVSSPAMVVQEPPEEAVYLQPGGDSQFFRLHP